MKIRLDIEYDGVGFFGWQRQDNSDVATVQGTLEGAIYQAFGKREPIVLYGAGRTDTGVHAINQVAHFEVIKSWNEDINKLTKALNFYLHDTGVVVKSSVVVGDDFHARFSAKRRQYVYLIHNRASDSVLLKNRAWNIRNYLDLEAMQESSRDFLGTHSFNAFRSADCQAKNAIKTVEEVTVKKDDNLIFISVSARSFLHNQVRIMVGTLKEIGLHKMSIEHIKKLLENGDRTKAGPTAPPYGLYLKNVCY